LAALALALAVVAGLAAALGYAWGRREGAVRSPVQGQADGSPRGSSGLQPVQEQARPQRPQGGPVAQDAAMPPPATQAETRPSQATAAAASTHDEGLSFSYTVSHDLRAPVRVVDGFARILKEDYSRHLDRIGNDHLDRILSAAARMNAMIDAMLSLAQLSTQPLARQPVNLSQLATYILEDLRRGQPERTVTVEIEPDLLVTGDPTLLRLVLENLLSNAWKYTGKTTSPSIHLHASEHLGRRVFEVRDNGAGFDMRSSDRLFGLFQRLHSANDFPGTGVGLASVQRIVRRHGGDIWAESTPGQGARFCFTLNA
jgi:signal transduction histidine kinase